MRSSQHYIAMSLYLRRARIIINNGIVNIGRTIGKPITTINGCTATGVVGNRIVIKIGYFNINGLTVGITARYGITGKHAIVQRTVTHVNTTAVLFSVIAPQCRHIVIEKRTIGKCSVVTKCTSAATTGCYIIIVSDNTVFEPSVFPQGYPCTAIFSVTYSSSTVLYYKSVPYRLDNKWIQRHIISLGRSLSLRTRFQTTSVLIIRERLGKYPTNFIRIIVSTVQFIELTRRSTGIHIEIRSIPIERSNSIRLGGCHRLYNRIVDAGIALVFPGCTGLGKSAVHLHSIPHKESPTAGIFALGYPHFDQNRRIDTDRYLYRCTTTVRLIVCIICIIQCLISDPTASVLFQRCLVCLVDSILQTGNIVGSIAAVVFDLIIRQAVVESIPRISIDSVRPRRTVSRTEIRGLRRRGRTGRPATHVKNRTDRIQTSSLISSYIGGSTHSEIMPRNIGIKSQIRIINYTFVTCNHQRRFTSRFESSRTSQWRIVSARYSPHIPSRIDERRVHRITLNDAQLHVFTP